MNEPRDHHYVPECLQKGFTNDSGRLYTANRQFPRARAKGHAPKATLYERDYYRTDFDTEAPLGVEHFLAGFENRSSPLLDELRQHADNGMPDGAGIAVGRVALFTAMQAMRTPYDREAVRATIRAIAADQALREMAEAGALYIVSGGKSEVPLGTPEHVKLLLADHPNSDVHLMIERARSLAEELSKMTMVLAVLDQPCLITGDNPVLLLFRRESQPDRELNQVVMPISSTAAVAFVRKPPDHPERWFRRCAASEWGRDISLRIARSSTRIAGRSQELVEGIAGAAWPHPLPVPGEAT